MAAKMTLDELVTATRAEVGDSVSMAQGADKLPAYRQMLRRIQETYYLDYDWPNLIVDREEALIAGERYYTLGEELNFDRISKADSYRAGRWQSMEYGIGTDELSAVDSDAGETGFRPFRWQVYEEGQIEVWPVPADSDGKIRFRGVRALPRLSAGSDVCLLDPTLLILTAAAEILARQKAEDAKLKLSMATSHYNRLRGRLQKSGVFSMLPGQPARHRVIAAPRP